MAQWPPPKYAPVPAPVTVSVSFDISSGICLRLMLDFIKLFTFFHSVFMSFLLLQIVFQLDLTVLELKAKV